MHCSTLRKFKTWLWIRKGIPHRVKHSYFEYVMAVNCQNLTFKVNTIFSKLFKLERRMLLLLWLNTSKQNFHFSGTKGPLKITFEMHCTIMNFIHCNFFAMAWLESSLLKRWCYGFTKTSMKCMLLRAAIIYIMEPQPVCTVGLFTNKCTNIQLLYYSPT